MTVGSIGGINIKISWWLISILALTLLVGGFEQWTRLFLLVILHESAHAITARRNGMAVTEIELMPFGGVARIESLHTCPPWTEAKVAAAGPMLNLLCALCMIGLAYCFPALMTDHYRLMIEYNIMILLVNLLPALPLDGGRILRALLTPPLGQKRAIKISAYLGMCIALILLAGGIYAYAFTGHLNATVIATAGFLLTAAWRESRNANLAAARALTPLSQPLSRVQSVRTLSASADITLQQLSRHLRPGQSHIVLVVDHTNHILGQLDDHSLLAAFHAHGTNVTLRRII